MDKLKLFLLGLFSGILNGVFGAGGGLVVVPLLTKLGLEQKKSHATSVSVILPLSIISAALYFKNGVSFEPKLFWLTAPAGLVGAIIGAALLKKINPLLIKRIFGVMIIISAVRIFFR